MDHEAEIVRVTSSFDAFAHRDASRDLGSMVRRGRRPRSTARTSRAIASTLIAIACLFAIALGVGLAVEWIGTTGLFLAAGLLLLLILVVGLKPDEAARPVPAFKETMPNKAMVQRLKTLLERRSAQLPPAAAHRAGAISRQLPQLETQLAGLDPLDPLAQDARRLMGQHLPELIERYERVPAQYRGERDGDGMSVDERLVAGLDAAREAVDDLSRRLAQQDVSAFETQGRFLESRYRPDELGTTESGR